MSVGSAYLIDPRTGRVGQSSGCEITGGLRKSAFAASAVFQSAKALVNHPPFASYQLPEQRIDGRDYAVSLWFEGEYLRRVSISDVGAEFGTSWNDGSEAKERQKQRQHDRVLALIFGRRSNLNHPWGKVESVFDPRSGSSIVITYQPPITASPPTAPDFGRRARS